MISARLVLAALIGGHWVVDSAGLAAEPARKPISPQVIQAPTNALAETIAVATTSSSKGPAQVAPPAAAQTPRSSATSDAWTPAEIAQARAHCAAILKGLDVVAISEEPFKKGACGAAAPVTLISVGREPEVVLSPPATVSCDIVAALHTWLHKDLQPRARKLLGAPVVEIETMSSYSCRNAYGRTRTKLSEHGRANALDIRGFFTASAQSTNVLADWGPTAREIRAQALAAAEAVRQKAVAEKEAADRAAASQPPPTASEPATQSESRAEWTVTIAAQIKAMLGLSGALAREGKETAVGLTASDRLGGPKPEGQLPPAAPPKSDAEARRMQFLRQAHASACKHFGTVLGPEANEAHRNHFHLDMAERQRSNFCE